MASSCLHDPSSPAFHGPSRCILVLLLGTFGVLAAPITEPIENLRVTGLPSARTDTDVDKVESRSTRRNLEEKSTAISAKCDDPRDVRCQSTTYEKPVADADDGNASFACETSSATLSQATAETIGSGESLAKRFLSPSQDGYWAGSQATPLILPQEHTTRDDRSALVDHPLLLAFSLASSLLFALGFFILLYRRKALAAPTVRLNISVTVRDHGYVKNCRFSPEL